MTRKLKYLVCLLACLSVFLFWDQSLNAEALGFPECPEENVHSVSETADYYETVEDAAAFLRQQMVERKTSVTIPFRASAVPDQSLLDDIIDAALEHTGRPCEGDYIAFHVSSLNGQMSGSFDGITAAMELTYTIEYYSTEEQESEVNGEVAVTLVYLNLTEEKNDYIKIKTIYDYICDNIRYDYEHLDDPEYYTQFTAYGACVNGTAVCQGYALLMYRMMLEVGVDCRIISGRGSGEPHAWNIVGIDGKYYNLDVTWDEGTADHRFFLKSNDDFPDHVRDEVYSSDGFTQAYPMGETDFESAARY